jgi:hypothetical protein
MAVLQYLQLVCVYGELGLRFIQRIFSVLMYTLHVIIVIFYRWFTEIHNIGWKFPSIFKIQSYANIPYNNCGHKFEQTPDQQSEPSIYNLLLAYFLSDH